MDNARRVRVEEMMQMRRAFDQSSIVQMCRQMIHNQLLNNGIKIGQGSKKSMKMSTDERETIEDMWVPFCADVIDSVLCYGFAVVYMGKCAPSVLRVGTFWMKVRLNEDKTTEFEVYEKDTADTLMENTVVFNHFGFEPKLDGSIVSPMTKIIPRLQFLRNIRETTMRMEIQRAFPQYFTEIKDNGNSMSSREGIDFDFYADAVATETSTEMQYKRNKEEVSMLNAQRDLYESYLNPSHARVASAMLENVTQLPMGHSVRNGTANTGRSDICNLHKILQEEVCATFGVPRSMMFADSATNRGHDMVGTHQTFMHTLLWWKRNLSVVLSECYNSINAKKIISKIDLKKNQCVEDLKQKYKINVYFPVTPFVSNDELRKLYEQGVISWKAYGEYALRNISLPIDDLQPKPPERDQMMFDGGVEREKKVEKPSKRKDRNEGVDKKVNDPNKKIKVTDNK